MPQIMNAKKKKEKNEKKIEMKNCETSEYCLLIATPPPLPMMSVVKVKKGRELEVVHVGGRGGEERKSPSHYAAPM